uniref:General transcription factor IIF subunit 2 n=1 Tax=Caenorhabditis tropicalis TaxID=1561998 RepID=A0A1I7T6B1_9PELO
MTTPKRFDNDVDCELAKRGIWLVKVPRYLSELWDANEGGVVGKLQIGEQVEFHTGKGLNQPRPKDEEGATSSSAPSDVSEIPTQYSFILNDVRGQTMSVLSEDKQGLGSEAAVKTGKLAIEGRIIKKAECRPPATSKYMKMKLAHIVKNTQPKKTVKMIDKAAVKFKPVSMHAEDMIKSKQKKDGAKTYRADRDVLRQALFKAFEKHSFYRLQDLQQLLQQPVSYVKEVLQEIAVYNTAPPHKSLWCLKPEYCNYKVNAQSEQ